MDSIYDAFHPYYDPNGDLALHASDDLRSEKNFHAREQAVYDQEHKLLLETQKYVRLNQEATLRDLQAVHAEQTRLKDVEIAHMQAQNETTTAANPPQPRPHTF